jgi:hypothetical protein
MWNARPRTQPQRGSPGLKPKHVNQPDRIGTFTGRETIGETFEATIPQWRSVMDTAPVICSDPHIIA